MFLYKLQNNELNFTPLFETQLRLKVIGFEYNSDILILMVGI